MLMELPESVELFWHLNGIAEPLRVDDLSGYMTALGMEELRPPVAVTSLLMAPIRNAGARVGSIYLTRREDGREFTREDEETLVMFASQVGRWSSPTPAVTGTSKGPEADLEALVNTSPVGVVVFDARTGVPVSYNRETLRIIEGLREPDSPPEQIMEILSLRRIDGREVSLQESPLAERLSSGRTIRAEEIVIQSARRQVGDHAGQRHAHLLAGRWRDGVGGGDSPGHDAPGGSGTAAGRVPGHGQP